MTVDRAYVLATPGLDRHAAYVALSRHRSGVELHYGRDDFADCDRLVRTLSRERGKDMASDYARDVAQVPTPVGDRAASAPTPAIPAREPPSPKRGMFDGLRLSVPRTSEPARSLFDGLALPSVPIIGQRSSDLDVAVRRVARATADIRRFGREAEPLPHQKIALETARRALDAARPDAARDLAAAFAGDPSLVDDAAKGRTAAVIRVMQLETELRTNPELRADRFVTAWQQLRAQREKLSGWQNETERGKVEQRMIDMGARLERDPQVESLLRRKANQLGLPAHDERRLSQAIPDWLSHSRERGIGR